MNNNSLSHTKWTCKCHIVFAPKFRKKLYTSKPPVELVVMICKNLQKIKREFSRCLSMENNQKNLKYKL